MKKIFFSDKELGEKTQEIFLEAAGFVIKLVFEPTEQIYFKRRLLEGIKKTWGRGGFLLGERKSWDFEIRLKGGINQIDVLEKNQGKKLYYLAFQKHFRRRKVITFYTISLLELELLLREVIAHLLKKDGFLLHGSSCLDKEGNLKVFLAPSGGGKSTMAKLLSKKKDIEDFSDDILIVRKNRNTWLFHSPPFVEKEKPPVKGKAKNAEFFFVKKSASMAKNEIIEQQRVLNLILSEIWLERGEFEKKTLANVMDFINKHKFYWLSATLDAKALWKIIYED